ncbi:MAG: beta-lactamase family protein [Hyphomicrobiales bacterium]|nr:beta-lactamase family protein [Hyphomicrobiales bacterium]
MARMSKDRGLDHAKPEKIGLNEKALDRLGETLKREIGEGRMPGAVAMIARRGRVGYFEAFGKRDPGAADAMEKDCIFRIYSMTKPLVSTAIMMLVEEGRILLGDPLSKYVPAFADVKVGVERDGELTLVAPERPITIQDLLRHTSGLTYDFVGGGGHPVQKLYAQADLAQPKQTNADQVEALAKLPLLNQPGACWDYSRSTDVLGRIVEIVSGRTLGEELSRRVFEPLDMKDTAFSVPQKHQDRIAEPFPIDPEAKTPVNLLNVRRPAMFESGGGGLASTAGDYARFCAMLAGGGAFGNERILARKTLELMASDHLGPHMRRGSDLLPAGHGFGLGFAVRNAPGMTFVPGSVGLFYWGGIAGTTFWIDPKEDLFALMMIQAPGQRDYYRMLFRTLVYAAVE